MRTTLQNAAGHSTLSSILDIAFELLICRQIHRFLELSLACVDMFNDMLTRLERAVESSDLTPFHRSICRFQKQHYVFYVNKRFPWSKWRLVMTTPSTQILSVESKRLAPCLKQLSSYTRAVQLKVTFRKHFKLEKVICRTNWLSRTCLVKTAGITDPCTWLYDISIMGNFISTVLTRGASNSTGMAMGA